MSEVLIVPTGSANIASVRAAFARLGATTRIADGGLEVETAPFVVLPGVGSFEAGMAGLREGGFVEPLRKRILEGQPTLAICLGLQLLGSGSDESEGVSGLGVWPEAVHQLRPSPLLPQMGWNAVSASGSGLVVSGEAYYANSFALTQAPMGWRAAWSNFGTPFVGAVEKDRVLACQFHPELSGSWGERLLQRWLTGTYANSEPLASGLGRSSRVIPCLDVRGGRVVKGIRFENLRDSGDPSVLAARYAEEGADEIVMLDVSATLEERQAAAETVAKVRAVLNIPLTVGGGVRCPSDAATLLDAGADKVGVNTAAVENPGVLSELAQRFGRQCVVVAIDAARNETLSSGYEVVTHSGKHRTGIDAVSWCSEAVSRGAGEILLTSWDQDGTRSGYELELIRRVGQAVKVPLIASGGASRPSDMVLALAAGADAVLAASIFHDAEITVAALKQAIAQQGVTVR